MPENSGARSGTVLCWPLAVHDPSTVTRVRATVHGVLAVLGLDAEAIDEAERGTAELVQNAVRHAWPPVELHVRIRDTTVVVELLDGNETLPRFPDEEAATPEPDEVHAGDEDVDLDAILAGLEETGRGLGLVRCFSAGHCGARPAVTCGDVPGKAVWFARKRPTPALTPGLSG